MPNNSGNEPKGKDSPLRFKRARPEIEVLLEDAGLYDAVSP